MKRRQLKIGAGRRLLGIVCAIVIGAVIAFAAVAARAQSRYDTDQTWVRQTIRETNRKALENYYGEPVEFVRRPRPRSQESHHHHYDSRDWRYRERQSRERDHEHHDRDRSAVSATRVYGVVMRRQQFVERNATSHVECFDAIQEQSGDFGSENKALNDAEVRWSAKVAVRYGAVYADFTHARGRERQCFRSTFDESWWGRNKEAAIQNLNMGDGYKKKCIVTARPCLAPQLPIEESRVEARTKTETEFVEPPRR